MEPLDQSVWELGPIAIALIMGFLFGFAWIRAA